MSEPKKVLYFKIKKSQNENALKDVKLGFDNGEFIFYNLTQTSLISTEVLEDEDANLTFEIQRTYKKMETISNSLINKGFEIISFEDYKYAEKQLKLSQQNNFIINLSLEEKLVYEKTKDFLEEYDIMLPNQRQFITSLRPFIVSRQNINETYLEEHAIKSKKDVNKIFDCGVQSMICDFVAKVQMDLENIKKPIKKTKKIN